MPSIRPWQAQTIAAGAGVVLLAATLLIVNQSASSSGRTSENVSAPATTTVTERITTTITVSPPAPAESATSGLQATITQGQWLVGTDVEPGTYRSPGPIAGYTTCFWFRKTADGSRTLDSSGAQGPSRVTLKSGELFENGSCQPFTKSG